MCCLERTEQFSVSNCAERPALCGRGQRSGPEHGEQTDVKEVSWTHFHRQTLVLEKRKGATKMAFEFGIRNWVCFIPSWTRYKY